jgi:hypothetical protein
MIVNVPFRPMRLLRVAQSFGHCDFIYELKLDGFRALADVDRIGLSSDLAKWLRVQTMGLAQDGKRPIASMPVGDSGRRDRVSCSRHTMGPSWARVGGKICNVACGCQSSRISLDKSSHAANER